MKSRPRSTVDQTDSIRESPASLSKPVIRLQCEEWREHVILILHPRNNEIDGHAERKAHDVPCISHFIAPQPAQHSSRNSAERSRNPGFVNSFNMPWVFIWTFSCALNLLLRLWIVIAEHSGFNVGGTELNG